MTERKKRSKIWKFDRNLLENVVKTSDTFSSILKSIGVFPFGNNQQTLIKRLELDNIDFSHIDRGLSSRKGKFGHGVAKNKLSDVLIEDSTYSRVTLKKRLLKEGILKNECYECGLGPNWNNKVLSLQIDHINGIYNDNRLENLRMLCPNCHSQTSTFARKREPYKSKDKLC